LPIIDTESLTEIIEIEFADIVEYAISGLNRMRILLKERSFIDIWYSIVNVGRYAYHWERKYIDGTIYRHDNAPHKNWREISTFPKHFHNRDENKVEPSEIPDEPEEGIRCFLRFVRGKVLR